MSKCFKNRERKQREVLVGCMVENKESAQVSSVSLIRTDKPSSWKRFLCFYNSTQAVNILLEQN